MGNQSGMLVSRVALVRDRGEANRLVSLQKPDKGPAWYGTHRFFQFLRVTRLTAPSIVRHFPYESAMVSTRHIAALVVERPLLLLLTIFRGGKRISRPESVIEM